MKQEICAFIFTSTVYFYQMIPLVSQVNAILCPLGKLNTVKAMWLKLHTLVEQELGADSEELGAEYIGCYKDGWGRDLPNVFIKDYSGNTPQKCISQCEKKGRYTSCNSI